MANVDEHIGSMSGNSNLNSDSSAASTASNSAAIAHTHPLQDVNLNQDDVDFMREIPLQNNNSISPITVPTPAARTTPSLSAATTRNKENWVKFDDEVNEIEANNETKTTNNNNQQNKNIAVNKSISSVDSENALQTPSLSLLSSSTTATNKAETTNAAASSLNGKNKLSPILLPPPQQQHHHHQTRSRTPPENKQQNQELSQQRNGASSTATAGTKVEAANKAADIAPAVLSTESTHVNLNSSGRRPQQNQQQPNQPHHQKVTKVNNSYATNGQKQQQHQSNNGTSSSAMSKATTASSSITIPADSNPQMRTIELSTGRIREGFANGDVIVTLLPANTRWPWITPAVFRPELVPEELMAQGLTLTVEEYVHAMDTLVNDYRFNMYNICYKRILVCWIFFAFAVLLTLLFSGLQGVALFSLGVGWLFLNAAAIFFCMWVKLRLSRGLEKCLANVNRQLMKHKILLVLDDRGRISCHKVNLCFLYFDPTLCVNFLNEFLEHTEQNGGEAIKSGWEAKLDIDTNDIIIQGSNPRHISRKQAVAQELFLSYLQRWGKDFLRRRLDWTVQEAGVHETPRHLQSSICPCQYEEEVLRNKIKMHLQRKHCCGINCIGCWL